MAAGDESIDTKIKICGVTTDADLRFVERAGADYVGVNLVAGPRRVELRVAENVLRASGGSATVVALIDASDATGSKLAKLGSLGFGCAQLYGAVTAEIIRRVRGAGLAPWLVVHVGSPEDAGRASERIAELAPDSPEMIVVDARVPGALGGTGARADWAAIAEEAKQAVWPPVMLAGGLCAENVEQAICTVRPSAVDVSSGVEKNPGLKDRTRVENFIRAVRSV